MSFKNEAQLWHPWCEVRNEGQSGEKLKMSAEHRKGFEHEKQNLQLDPLGNGSPVNLNDPWTFVDDCWCTIMYHMKLIKEFWGARPERMALQYFQRRRVQGMNQNVCCEQIKVPRKSPEMLLGTRMNARNDYYMADKEERVAKDNSKTFSTGRNVDLTTNFRDKYKLQWFQL